MTPHDPDGLDRDVREALAVALGEKAVRLSVKLTDKRLLILYLLAIAFAAALLALVDARTNDRDALVAACQDTRRNALALNKALDQLSASSATSPVLAPAERKARAAFYAGLQQKVPTCPPRS